MMAKPFRTLREKMSPEARAEAEAKACAMMKTMPLAELRQARRLSQEQLAASLHVRQAAVSKLERRTDMYISTLRNFVKAMGGDLVITAQFPEGSVKIDQFEEIPTDFEEMDKELEKSAKRVEEKLKRGIRRTDCDLGKIVKERQAEKGQAMGVSIDEL